MFGALFGFIGNLVGSIFSKPKKPAPAPEPQVVKVVETQNKSDLKTLVADSKEAGFNPLTVLKAGGASAFQITQTPFLTTNPEYVNWQANEDYKQRKSAWLGNTIASIGSGISNVYGAYQTQQRRTLENQLLYSEIYRNNSAAQSYSLQPRQALAPSSEWHQASNGQPIALPDGWEAGKVTVTDPHEWGEVNPYFSDAEAFEQRYGDIAQELAGVSNIVGDAAWNLAPVYDHVTGAIQGGSVKVYDQVVDYIGSGASYLAGASDYFVNAAKVHNQKLRN